MKKIILSIFILLGLSCQENQDNIFDNLTIRGGFVEFAKTPTLSFNILDLDRVEINETILDTNGNTISYDLSVTYEGVTVNNLVSLTSFPANLVITLPMLLDAFNLTEGDLTLDSEFSFIATVTTPTGSFKGDRPKFNTVTKEEEGGNTASQLNGASYKPAFIFKLSFFMT
ncbi:hypothetical protein [Flavivirga eckloniae]|uniref:Uncharacterized protein n=1 Tax=Flavivirga eckloniae TaxID=1803846 RepID=A0A2K9PPY9_9FLAO|nr:hypothetical protein [Flavivirga eckloniae]AUP79106.1 hypothetical protein C1H87_10510 [Flavivirga eckloniae]